MFLFFELKSSLFWHTFKTNNPDFVSSSGYGYLIQRIALRCLLTYYFKFPLFKNPKSMLFERERVRLEFTSFGKAR